MTLHVLDVIRIRDQEISPPGPKEVACVEPAAGFFFRINSNPWPEAVLIERQPYHAFLHHDSYLECGQPIELDDYIVTEAINAFGIIGRIHDDLVMGIINALNVVTTISNPDKDLICRALTS